MIYKYDVKEINGLKYVTGSRLTSEFGKPSEEYEFEEPFGKEQVDENGKYQWTIRNNTDYNPETDPISARYLIENNPIPKTIEEINLEEKQAKKNKLDAEYPQEKILELQDQAIQTLARNEKLPREYEDYVTFKENINAAKA